MADAESLNSPRWPAASGGGFHEAWFVSGSDAKAGYGLWLRYGVDVDADGGRDSAVWASWFSRDAPDRNFVIRNLGGAAAAVGRAVEFEGAELRAEGCTGEVEAGGHTLRWRVSFGPGAAAEEVVPAWISPVARLRGSGYVLPHPATTLSGALEVDGRMFELQRMPAAQGHLWGRSYWPAWAWARCSGFVEDPEASIDLLDVEGPRGVRLPLFAFRFRGATHRFAGLPWMALARSVPVAPAWHFAAQDARLSIDGVVRAPPEQMVQVQYVDSDRSVRHCVHTALASMEVRVRSRAFPGGAWRPEATLTSKWGASLEFCGRAADARVTRMLVSAAAPTTTARAAGSVAS